MTQALSGIVSAVEFRTVEFAGSRFTVCQINVREEHLQLFHRDDTGQPFKRFDQLAPWIESRNRKLVFAMNAGMFHGDFSAVGLFVADGKEAVPLNTAAGEGNFFLKPNGVFALTASGARVIESSEYPRLREPVLLATQSGPLLVRAGKLHPAFRANSESRLFRNGVGVPSPDIALFVISEAPVNFYEFATL
ncbi:MAG: phosphodiester glycosidase family protein, partial [Verrucomicrobiales bacterium]